MIRKHYEEREDAILGLSELTDARGWTIHNYVAGILTIAVPDNQEMRPLLLLREQEGLYWEEPDA